jgi:hypothetical protein
MVCLLAGGGAAQRTAIDATSISLEIIPREFVANHEPG